MWLIVSGLEESATKRPPLGLWHLHEQVGRIRDLAADHVGFVVDVQRAADDVAAHQHGRIVRKAPVRAQAVDRICGRIELFHAPVLEHAGRAVLKVATLPDVSILVRVAGTVVFHLLAQARQETKGCRRS
jgi:hypothetical protein